MALRKSLLSIYLIGNAIGYGIWLQFAGSCGDEGIEGYLMNVGVDSNLYQICIEIVKLLMGLKDSLEPTWTPKVCKHDGLLFYRWWAIVLPTFGSRYATAIWGLEHHQYKVLRPIFRQIIEFYSGIEIWGVGISCFMKAPRLEAWQDVAMKSSVFFLWSCLLAN